MRRRRSVPIPRPSAPATPFTCPVSSGSTRKPATWSRASRRRRTRCSSNLRAVAAAAGGTLDDMVKLSVLMLNLGDFAQSQRDHGELFHGTVIRRARRTRWRHCRSGALIEIEGILVLPPRCGRSANRMARDVRPDQGSHRATERKPKAPDSPRRAFVNEPSRDPGQDCRAQKARGPRTCRPAGAARHRSRCRPRAAPAAALRGPHARSRRSRRCAGRCRCRSKARRQHRHPVPAAPPARLPDRRSGTTTRRQLVLRFFTFYPSQQKALEPGTRVRVFGDVREATSGSRWCIRSSRWSRRTRRCPTA